MSEAEEQYKKFPEAMQLLCDMINSNPQISYFTWWMALQGTHYMLSKCLKITREEYKAFKERAEEVLKNLMPDE